MKYILLTGTAILAVLLAAGYYGFINVFDSQFHRKGRVHDEAYVDSERDVNRPTSARLQAFRKERQKDFTKLELEEIQTQSFDGLQLKGWLLKGNPKEVVICVHGYKVNPQTDFCDRVSIYLKRGSTVLFPLNRAHEGAEGRYIGFSELDRYDVQSWVRKINQMYDQPGIYLHGVSMGGATVVRCADMDLENLQGIIDDCGYDSISSILDHVWKNSFHIPFVPFGYFTAFWARVLAHMDILSGSGEKSLSRSRVPVLIIHGREDHFVPYSMAERMYASCASRKKLVPVENCGHAAAYMCDPERYTAEVEALLDGKM